MLVWTAALVLATGLRGLAVRRRRREQSKGTPGRGRRHGAAADLPVTGRPPATQKAVEATPGGRRSPVDLVVALLGVLTSGAVLATGAPAVRLPAGVSLALLLPGYALSRAVLAPGTVTRAERATTALALSVISLIIVSLAVNLSPWELSKRSWALGAGGTTVLASGLARIRAPGRGASPVTIKLPRLRDVALLLVSLATITTTVVLARRPLPPPKHVGGYTQLWLVPGPGGPELGVASYELRTTRYRLELMADGRPVRRWDTISLAPGRRWTVTVGDARGALDAQLYRVADTVPYRQVHLEVASQSRA